MSGTTLPTDAQATVAGASGPSPDVPAGSSSAPANPAPQRSDAPVGRDKAPASGKSFLGYYVPYDPTSWESLSQHHADLQYVAVQMASVDACGNLTTTDDRTLLSAARGWGVRVLLSLFTSSGATTHELLTRQASADNLVQQIVRHVRDVGYDGLDLDLEGVPAGDRAALTSLTAKLGEALHREGKMFTMAVPAKTQDSRAGWGGAFEYAALGPNVDLLVVMAYAYTTASSSPGAMAPLPWTAQVASFAASQVPPNKVLLGVPFYGYDWNVTVGGTARALRYPEAAATAKSRNVPIQMDDATKSATFTYSQTAGDPTVSLPQAPKLDHDISQSRPPACNIPMPTPPASASASPKPTVPQPSVQRHIVWFEDANTLSPRLDIVQRLGLAGSAAWRLGQEDPRVWDVLAAWQR